MTTPFFVEYEIHNQFELEVRKSKSRPSLLFLMIFGARDTIILSVVKVNILMLVKWSHGYVPMC